MEFIIRALSTYIPLLAFTGLLGLAVMPASLTAREDRTVCTLIAPAMGSAIWCAVTVPLGLLLRFDGVLLWPALLAAVGFIALRCRHLRPHVDMPCALFALGAVLASVFVMYHIAPHMIDGGLYFGKAVAVDHCKAAMVDSIAGNGLPPLNPWLADDGVPVPVSYYFGWHAMAAQLCIMVGMSGYLADVAFAGFNVVIVLLGMGGIVLRLGGRKTALALLMIFSVLNSSFDVLLPESLRQSLFPSGFVGF